MNPFTVLDNYKSEPIAAKRKYEVTAKFVGLRPHALLDAIKATHKLRKETALADLLDVAPAWVSKVRNRRVPASAEFILAVHENTGMPVKEIRQLLAVS